MFLRLHTDFGFSVVPCRPGAKAPWLDTWTEFQHERPTLDQVTEWARTYQRWGIITGRISGIVVVDTDSPEAENWALENLPATPWAVYSGVKERFRGVHRYYRRPNTEERIGGKNKLRIALDRPKLGLDVRADGGFVVGPGSPHESGVTYEMTRPWDPSELAELPVYDPAWFPVVEELPVHPVRIEPITRVASADSGKKTSPFNRASEWILRRDPAVTGNGGDQHTYLTACNLLEFGITAEEAWALLVDWNQTCQPPWDEKGLRTKFNNALRFGGRYSKANKEAPGESLDWLETLEVPWHQRPPEDNLSRLRGSFGVRAFTGVQAAELLADLSAVRHVSQWLEQLARHGFLSCRRGVIRTYQFPSTEPAPVQQSLFGDLV